MKNCHSDIFGRCRHGIKVYNDPDTDVQFVLSVLGRIEPICERKNISDNCEVDVIPMSDPPSVFHSSRSIQLRHRGETLYGMTSSLARIP